MAGTLKLELAIVVSSFGFDVGRLVCCATSKSLHSIRVNDAIGMPYNAPRGACKNIGMPSRTRGVCKNMEQRSIDR